MKLFPFPHIPARYLCILSAADPRFQIAEAAAEGLQPGKFAAGDGSGDAPKHPPFAAVLQFVQQRLPQLGRRPAEGASLALPAKVGEPASAAAAAAAHAVSPACWS
jgi:proteasome component ECM29